MSEIQEFLAELKAQGPLAPGEESVADLFEEWEEPLPILPGIDPRTVSSDLYGHYERAAEEHKEEMAIQQERQEELDHDFARGRAMKEGMQGQDPAVQHQTFVRDLPPATRRKVQRVDNLRQKIHDAAVEADLKRMQAERSGSGYVADKLMEEAHRLEFNARLDQEEFDAIQEEGFDTFKEDQNLSALESEQQLLTVFDRPAGSVPLSHVDEKIAEANRSSAPSGYSRRGNDKLFKVTVEGQTTGTVFERLRNDGRMEDVPDHELLINAAERGVGGYKYRVELLKDAPSQQPEPKEPAPEEPAGDIEVVDVSGGGVPETTYHDTEEEPKPEPDAPRPKTNIHTFM